MTRISVAIAAFNAEAYVAAAVESVLSQTLPADEIIVVDDGSDDRTVEILSGFGDRIRLIAMPHRGGPAAFSTAVAATSGELLAFNDADDLWAPEKLALQSACLAAQPEIDAVFGAVQQFTQAERPPAAPFARAAQPGISKIGLLVRRAAFERFGGFDTRFALAEFVGWYAAAMAQGLRAVMLPEIVAFRRLHAGNSGRLQRSEQRDENLLLLKRALDLRRGKTGST